LGFANKYFDDVIKEILQKNFFKKNISQTRVKVITCI